MKISEYPLVDYYIKKIKILIENEYNLGALLMLCTLNELIVKEIANDYSDSVYSLSNKLLEDGRLNHKQYEIIDEIRTIRNQYIHIDKEKMVWNFDGWVIIEDFFEPGMFLNELVLSSDETDKEFLNFYKIRTKLYVKDFYKKIKYLLKTL